MGSTPSKQNSECNSKVESPHLKKQLSVKNNLTKTSSCNSANQNKSFSNIKLPALNIKQNTSYQSSLNTPQHLKFEIDSVKIVILGMHIAVGKSTLLRNFVQQKSVKQSHNPTLGMDLQITQYQDQYNNKITYKIYEIQNSEQMWQKIPQADIYFLVFDEFDLGMEEKIKQKIKSIQYSEQKKHIILVGNDKLDMQVTGKEKLLQSESLKQIFKDIRIIDFNNMREVNDLFMAAYNIHINNKNIEQQQLFPIQRQNSSTNETNSCGGQCSSRFQVIEDNFNKI